MYKLFTACTDILGYLGDLAHNFTDMLTSPLSIILTDSVLGTVISFLLPDYILGATLMEFVFGGLITYIIAKLCYNFIKP